MHAQMYWDENACLGTQETPAALSLSRLQISAFLTRKKGNFGGQVRRGMENCHPCVCLLLIWTLKSLHSWFAHPRKCQETKGWFWQALHITRLQLGDMERVAWVRKERWSLSVSAALHKKHKRLCGLHTLVSRFQASFPGRRMGLHFFSPNHCFRNFVGFGSLSFISGKITPVLRCLFPVSRAIYTAKRAGTTSKPKPNVA